MMSKIDDEVNACLETLNISAGDTVLIHSDAKVAVQFREFDGFTSIDMFVDSLKRYLGKNGTLIMPAFTYSYTKGEAYDRKNSPSTVGLITEHFRKKKGVERSDDPLFSICATGKDENRYVAATDYYVFGGKSFFSELHSRNAFIVGLGCPLERGGTFFHYIEKMNEVSYRYEKCFSGLSVNCQSALEEVSYFVRDLSRDTDIELSLFRDIIRPKKLLNETSLGRVSAWSIRAKDCFDVASEMLSVNKCSLIVEGC